MKINELIKAVANLVVSREIIDHGTIRCIYSKQAVQDIESAEGCDEVGTGEIGDDELAGVLEQMAENGDMMADLDLGVLVRLEKEYIGDDLENYISDSMKNELCALNRLIYAARELAYS